MKKILIIQNSDKDPDHKMLDKVTSMLVERDCDVACSNNAVPKDDDFDCLLVLGGDGTMLRCARQAYDRDIPLVGINLGTLGYLTEMNTENFEKGIDALVCGKYRIEDRMMIEGRVFRDGILQCTDVALNDVAVIRRGKLRIMRFINRVNGTVLSAFNADGVIVATPTGSTGYSLSAGGPVISPGASLLSLTAIASHTINTRSIILPDTDVIEVEIGADRSDDEFSATVCFDGEEMMRLKTGDVVELRKSRNTTKMIKIFDGSFLDVLRMKMQMA